MNSRDRAQEVVEEWSAAFDADEETDLEEFITRALDAAAAEARADEREACARLAEPHGGCAEPNCQACHTRSSIADFIRARGEVKP